MGSSVDILVRWCNHRHKLNGGVHYNSHLQNSWNKYGGAAFEWWVIELVENSEELLVREQYWLDRYFDDPYSCYNVSQGAGGGRLGVPHTPETCAKLSEMMTGRKKTAEHIRNHAETLRGRKLSDSHKQKISESLSGRVFTEEHKRKISEAHKGKKMPPFSAEHRRKLSEAQMGNQYALGYKCTEEHKRKISKAMRGENNPFWSKHHTEETRCRLSKSYPSFIHRDTGEIIPAGRNLAQMCREKRLCSKSMYRVKNGERNHHKGWMLLEKEI